MFANLDGLKTIGIFFSLELSSLLLLLLLLSLKLNDGFNFTDDDDFLDNDDFTDDDDFLDDDDFTDDGEFSKTSGSSRTRVSGNLFDDSFSFTCIDGVLDFGFDDNEDDPKSIDLFKSISVFILDDFFTEDTDLLFLGVDFFSTSITEINSGDGNLVGSFVFDDDVPKSIGFSMSIGVL